MDLLSNNNLTMNFSRQAGIIQTAEFKDKTVAIIGCGSVGSEIARGLAKIGFGQQGCGTIKLFDFDTVENHNLSNQWFFRSQIGMKKVEALKGNLALFDCNSIMYDMKVTSEVIEHIGLVDANIIFLAVDDNDARRDIMEEIIPNCAQCQAVIESGMSLTGTLVRYHRKENWNELMEKWLGTWVPSSEQEVSACGTTETSYPTVVATALEALKNFIRHYNTHWASKPNESVGEPIVHYDIENFLFKGIIKRDKDSKATAVR